MTSLSACSCFLFIFIPASSSLHLQATSLQLSLRGGGAELSPLRGGGAEYPPEVAEAFEEMRRRMGYEEMEQEQKDLFDKLFAQAYTAQQDMQTKDVRPKLEKGVDKFMKKADMICQNPNITNYLNQMIYTLDPDEMDPEDREDFLEEMGEMHVIYAARQGFADMLAKLVRYEPALANSSVPSSQKLSALHWTAIKSASTVGDPGDNKYAGFGRLHASHAARREYQPS
ncbi:hypothetical protein GUITHDRAFT_137832 [Guillardia theta CCMP2712]|uniref:Uncharacterized protein n=1 Tax=Guillardia theta (strain CCMP2712) TaxID=905079 RepID=L1JEW7_GUITC|nr:hypothetical protein GUITHDRAFT_137832 [Guillardia theta CCMP2712]EKX46827.1 hypothetical protein GUITHDRAFT_137832 [Guillardia theta CCMP2712]|eukprot:XP_005833807.1 hypothetical protein GUITHDRAFT_137832 [Guillardia theta CCMP2712]